MAEKQLCPKDIDPVVYFFAVCFGIGSWITVNGLWVELPTIVPYVPESWALASYLSIIIQIANIGPIVVALLHFFKPGTLKDSVIAYVIIIVSAVSCVLLAFTWNTKGHIGGTEHSVALLILVFFMSLADTTSSVVFIPFMSLYKPVYMTALYIGEGMSGLLPGFVALGQGVGESSCKNVSKFNLTSNTTYIVSEKVYEGLRFPVSDFMFFLCAMMVVSGFGFTMLNFLPHCKKEQVHTREKSTSNVSMPYVVSSAPPSSMMDTDISTYSILSDDGHLDRNSTRSTPSYENEVNDNKTESYTKMGLELKVYLLVIIGVLNFMGNGLMSSTSTYSSLPYGEKAFHLSATLGNIANPVACLLALFLNVRSVSVISVLWTIWMVLSAYTLYLAAASPYPVLVGTVTGSALMVSTTVAASFMISYVKVCIAILFREQGKSALVWLGGTTQLGSFLGSVLGYILVNVAKVFISGETTC